MPDPNQVPSLRWGVLGPGNIAQTFIGSVQKHTSQKFLAVASKTAGRASETAARFGIPNAFESYEELLAMPEIDAVYIATYISDHFEHAMMALNAGKHVLVEKPITYLPEQAQEIFETARSKGLLAMEALWTRYLPQSDVIRRLMASGELGQPELMQASFCVDGRHIPRLWEVGGGGIVFDMGIYPISMAQQFLGNPTKVSATGKVAGVMDQESYITLEYQGGARAVLMTSGISTLPITASCSFENGVVVIQEPFLSPTAVKVRNKEFYSEESVWKDESPVIGHEGLSYQANYFADYVSRGLTESELHGAVDTVANIKVAFEVATQLGARPWG
jgi:predicted dehydrogenase